MIGASSSSGSIYPNARCASTNPFSRACEVRLSPRRGAACLPPRAQVHPRAIQSTVSLFPLLAPNVRRRSTGDPLDLFPSRCPRMLFWALDQTNLGDGGIGEEGSLLKERRRRFCDPNKIFEERLNLHEGAAPPYAYTLLPIPSHTLSAYREPVLSEVNVTSSNQDAGESGPLAFGVKSPSIFFEGARDDPSGAAVKSRGWQQGRSHFGWDGLCWHDRRRISGAIGMISGEYQEPILLGRFMLG